jgi:tRNA/tmRNA/rRNA uracil-C5-methylase (TrmA/RlmC/RlmD family)
MAGGSLKVNEIYQVIKNGYEWPELKPLKGYKYLKDLSNTFHQVYKNEKQKRIIVNYTGTKGIIDWLNNLDYILQTYTLFPRFQNAKAVLDKVLKRFPNYKITLVSHSQGGIITRELSKLYGDELFEIIALNPGNMSVIEGVKTFFGDDKKRIKENEYTIKSEADFASFFAKKNKNDIIITNETGDIIKEHGTDILFRLNPDLEIGRK